MELTTALLVEEVRKHPNGSVDLIGLFEDIFVGELPVTIDRLTLFLDLEIADEDRGRRHRIDLQLKTADGKPVGDPFPIRFDLPGEKDFPPSTVQLDPDFTNVTFYRPGLHFIEISIGGIVVKRLRLSIAGRA